MSHSVPPATTAAQHQIISTFPIPFRLVNVVAGTAAGEGGSACLPRLATPHQILHIHQKPFLYAYILRCSINSNFKMYDYQTIVNNVNAENRERVLESQQQRREAGTCCARRGPPGAPRSGIVSVNEMGMPAGIWNSNPHGARAARIIPVVLLSLSALRDVIGAIGLSGSE